MRRHGLDWLRGVASFGIVGCHLSLNSRTNSGEWVTALCDFNVGLFAAIAGYLTNIGGAEYIKKRAWRLLPTYFVWSLVYVAATAIYDLALDGGSLDARYYTLSNWVKVLFWGDAAAHLWFLVCLFYAQVGLWGTDAIMKRWKMPNGLKLVILVGMSIAFLAIGCISGNWWCAYPARLVAFFLLGYGMKNYQTDWILGPLLFTGLMLGVHLGGHGIIPAFVRDYLLVIPVLMIFTSSTFKAHKMATWLAATSMGVYLVHPLFARIVSFGLTRIFAPPYNAGMVIGEWVVVWGLSLALVTAMKRIPVTARWVR